MPRSIFTLSFNLYGIFSPVFIRANVYGKGLGNQPQIRSAAIGSIGIGENMALADDHPLDANFFKEEQRPKLAREALHGIAGEFVDLTLPETEADEVALLVSFLAGSGVLFGNRAYGVACGRRHPPTDFYLLVGKTGQGRKGTATGHALALMNAVDQDFERLHVIRGLSSGEGLVQKISDRSQLMTVQERRVLAVIPEFGGLLEVMTRKGNTLSYNVRQAWDGDPLHVATRGDPLEVSDVLLGSLGHVTAAELLNNLSQVSFMNGFANRYMHFDVHRSKLLPEGGPFVDYSALAGRLRQVVAIASARGGVLVRDEDAKHLWAQHYERLSTPEDNLRGALLSRAEAHCLRLSVLYALLDGVDTVAAEHVRAALALWAYSESSVGEIFGDRLGDPDAEKILDAMKHGPLSMLDVSNLFGRNKSAEWLRAKLKAMEKADLIVETEKEFNRKTVPAWKARKS